MNVRSAVFAKTKPTTAKKQKYNLIVFIKLMSLPEINLVHIMRPPQRRTFFGSSVRTIFLRAWVFTAFKVLLIASILNGSGLIMSIEKDISMLDQYFRNDYTYVDLASLPTVTHNVKVPKVIIAELFQPRGPEEPEDGLVAGAETDQAQAGQSETEKSQ